MVLDEGKADDHIRTVCDLHETLYSQPFRMPDPPQPKQRLGSMLSSPVKSVATWSDGMEPSSEAFSEVVIDDEDLKVS